MDNLRQTPQLSFAFEDPREIPCVRCGKPFLPNPDRKKYCSTACYKLRWERACLTCGKNVTVRPSEANKVYCSKACRYPDFGKRPPLICERCGKEYQTRVPQERDDSRFCSRVCRRNRVSKTCPGCGIDFELRICEAHWIYCSAACRDRKKAAETERLCPFCHIIKPIAEFRKRSGRGSRRACTFCLDHLDRQRLLADMKWARQVKHRDNYTCQFCGQKGGVLCADHILGYTQYPQYALALWNGRTLCTDCHLWRHALYGGYCMMGNIKRQRRSSP